MKEFKQAREEVIELVKLFPKGRREKVLFGQWSLKNLLSHLSGWAKYQIGTLRQLKRKVNIEVPKNLKASINHNFVAQREKRDWDRVYREFLGLSEELIEEYESSPSELWKNKVYKDKDKETTVEDFIKIEINHYSKTHSPQIKRVLRAV